MGLQLSREIQAKFPLSSFEFQNTHDDQAIAQVTRGEAHLAIITSEAPPSSGLSTKILAEAHFVTVAGPGHPLFGSAKAKKAIHVEKVLEHSFVSPNLPLLGKVGLKQSLDGWRDDQFPRKVDYLTSSLKLMEELVAQGRALAYLPDYFAKRIGAESLKITGCPYTCTQKVRLIAKNPKDRSWLNPLFKKT